MLQKKNCFTDERNKGQGGIDEIFYNGMGR